MDGVWLEWHEHAPLYYKIKTGPDPQNVTQMHKQLIMF